MASPELDEEEIMQAGPSGVNLIPRVHLGLPKITEEVASRIAELRALLEASPFFESAHHREYLHEQTLLRFLVAREFNVDKSRDLLLSALAWRDIRQPHNLSALSPEMEFQGRTGKIYLAGWDRWQRPVVIFDNSANNSNDADAQMRHLAFNLEKALWRASQRQHLHVAEGRKPVAKVVIFMHMYNFSLFNCPPFKVTRETIQIVTSCYPETMGHCIIYQPPMVFSAFFESVKRFIDPRSASKIIMISGDTSKGSANDVLLSDLIGPDWKELTGAGQPVVKSGCSPGYDHATYWPALVHEDTQRLQRPPTPPAHSVPSPPDAPHAPSHAKPNPHHKHRHSRSHSHSQEADALPPRPNRPTPLDRSGSPVCTKDANASTATDSRGPSPLPHTTPLCTPDAASSTTLTSSSHRQTSPKVTAAVGLGGALISAASAFAWTASSVGVPTAAPTSFLLRLAGGPMRTNGPDAHALPAGEEYVSLVLLSLLALSILLTYPNPSLSICHLLGGGHKGHIARQRSLLPLRKSKTPTLVASSNVLLTSAQAPMWGKQKNGNR